MSIGSDFESFLQVEGKIVPVSEEMHLGDKYGAHVTLKGGTMHRDNVMVELCIRPADTPEEFASNCIDLAREAEHCLESERGMKDVKLIANPVAQFSSAELAMPSAHELGCDVDYLAVLAESVERGRINAATLGNIRCAGGHIHISYGCTNKVPVAIAVGFCDIALGGLELGMGSQQQRREHYGIAGLHRSKWYGQIGGVEYRTVSNLWLRDKKYAIAMGTNALSLERMFNDVSVSRLGEMWEKLVRPGVMRVYLRQERRAAAQAMMENFAKKFPEFPWVTGV